MLLERSLYLILALFVYLPSSHWWHTRMCIWNCDYEQVFLHPKQSKWHNRTICNVNDNMLLWCRPWMPSNACSVFMVPVEKISFNNKSNTCINILKTLTVLHLCLLHRVSTFGSGSLVSVTLLVHMEWYRKMHEFFFSKWGSAVSSSLFSFICSMETMYMQ